MNSGPPSPVSREQLTRRIRSQLQLLLHDQSGDVPVGVAIYTLSDPRDVRDVRYVGQTRSPRRRLLQHVNTARLWL
ncbi:MAG TPA: GIY-YIG nuclease family protein, partial [Steroidobacteraceae bacterium]|nr:GIY-YIG nuclease family protein [Steroidobacteraceae bacterium]